MSLVGDSSVTVKEIVMALRAVVFGFGRRLVFYFSRSHFTTHIDRLGSNTDGNGNGNLLVMGHCAKHNKREKKKKRGEGEYNIIKIRKTTVKI